MRLLLFLSALLTGLTGFLPAVGVVGARQVAHASAAKAIVTVLAESQTKPTVIPEQPLARESVPVFLTPAPAVDVRARIDSARE